MSQIQVVGLDLAKQVFQVHAVAADGSVVVKRQLRRSHSGNTAQLHGPGFSESEAPRPLYQVPVWLTHEGFPEWAWV